MSSPFLFILIYDICVYWLGLFCFGVSGGIALDFNGYGDRY